MSSCDVGVITSCLCFIASLFTTLQGIAYLILRLEGLDMRWEECSFFEQDCNYPWRGIFSFRPNILFDVWTPLLLGVLGMSIHVMALRFCALFQSLLPATYIHYAFFMAITALFGNVGYIGQCGVIIAILSGVAVLFCILARLLGEGSVKLLQTKW
mmetsp:Transcript_26513/g.76449  ORF Transcript_26513/g.76449 Transcript_26513/m.76449 type:complete len:156 (-) Transcript_26513:146-613(-)